MFERLFGRKKTTAVEAAKKDDSKKEQPSALVSAYKELADGPSTPTAASKKADASKSSSASTTAALNAPLLTASGQPSAPTLTFVVPAAKAVVLEEVSASEYRLLADEGNNAAPAKAQPAPVKAEPATATLAAVVVTVAAKTEQPVKAEAAASATQTAQSKAEELENAEAEALYQQLVAPQTFEKRYGTRLLEKDGITPAPSSLSTFSLGARPEKKAEKVEAEKGATKSDEEDNFDFSGEPESPPMSPVRRSYP